MEHDPRAHRTHDVAKPWYRARNITLAIFALIAGVAVWTIVKAVTAVPGSPIDYAAQVQALAVSRQPAEGVDGYPIFARVLETMQAAHDRVKAEAGDQPADLPRNSGWPIDYSALSEPDVHPLVYEASLRAVEYASADGLLTDLDALTKAPRTVWPKAPTPLVDTLLPHLGQSRNLARMGAARMGRAAGRADWDEVARAFDHTMAVSRVCDAQGFLISRLVSAAIDHLAMSRARTIVASADVSEAALVRMLAAVESSGCRAPFEDILEVERLYMLDCIQSMFTDDGNGDGTLIVTKLREFEGTSTSGVYSWKIVNLLGVALPGKKTTIAKVDELFTGLKTYSATAPGSRAALGFQPDRWVDQLPQKYASLKVLAPALGKAVVTEDRAKSMWDGTRVMFAVEIYKRRHGAYPDALDQLVPSILAEVPKDLYGGTYRYARLAPGQDPGGALYTLYSVGADGKDEQGAAGKGEGSAYSGTPSGDYRFNSPK